jgi:hypothetical protein
MRLIRHIFKNFFSVVKILPRLVRKANYNPSLEVLRVSKINLHSSIVQITVSMTNILFLRINGNFFFIPRSNVSLTFSILTADKKDLKIKGYGFLKSTQILNYNLAGTKSLHLKEFNPKIKPSRRLMIRTNSNKIKVATNNLQLEKKSISIVNQKMAINHASLNASKEKF